MSRNVWPHALRIRACLCGHDEIDHSQVLAGSPCLDCSCPSMMRASEYGLSTFPPDVPLPGEPTVCLLDHRHTNDCPPHGEEPL